LFLRKTGSLNCNGLLIGASIIYCKPLVATERETRNDNYNQSVRNLQAYFGRLHLFMVILPAKIFKVILTLLATEFETGNDNYN
jgi:hypothetical protein